MAGRFVGAALVSALGACTVRGVPNAETDATDATSDGGGGIAGGEVGDGSASASGSTTTSEGSATSGAATSATVSTSTGSSETTDASAGDGSVRLDIGWPGNCPFDSDEPNDTPATATPSPGGDQLLCTGHDDIDMHWMIAPTNGWAGLWVGVEDTPLEVEAALHAGDGFTVLASERRTGRGELYVARPGLPGGMYWGSLRVVGPAAPGQVVRFTIDTWAGCVEGIPCQVQSTSPTPGEPCTLTPEYGQIALPQLTTLFTDDCREIPRLTTCDAGDGWAVPQIPEFPGYDNTRIELCGSWCDALANGTTFEVNEFCEP